MSIYSQDSISSDKPMIHPHLLSIGISTKAGFSIQYQRFFWMSDNNWKAGGQFTIEIWPNWSEGLGLGFVSNDYSINTGIYLAKGNRHNALIGMSVDYNWAGQGLILPSPYIGYAFIKPNAFYFGFDLRSYVYSKSQLQYLRRFPADVMAIIRFGRNF